MPLRASANAAKKLGIRLSSGQPVSDDDDIMLNEFIASYDEPMERTATLVRSLGYEATTRLKTRGTLIEKLRRDPNTKLPSVQDVAGLRITVANRVHQDQAVEQILLTLSHVGLAAKSVDRRENPSSGYRAVHVIAKVDGTPVEIQIRTVLQDLWAQVSERMGDRYGRGIRYGAAPEPTGDTREDRQRLDFVTAHRETVSKAIHDLERRYAEHVRQHAEVKSVENALEGLMRQTVVMAGKEPKPNRDQEDLKEQNRQLLLRAVKVKATLNESLERLATLAVATKEALQKQIDELSNDGGVQVEALPIDL